MLVKDLRAGDLLVCNSCLYNETFEAHLCYGFLYSVGKDKVKFNVHILLKMKLLSDIHLVTPEGTFLMSPACVNDNVEFWFKHVIRNNATLNTKIKRSRF